MNLEDVRAAVGLWSVHRACEALIFQYAQFIDFGVAEKVADLFAPDGIWESDRTKKVGQDEIRSAFRAREVDRRLISRHVCTNISIETLSLTDATGLTYFTLYRRQRVSPPESLAPGTSASVPAVPSAADSPASGQRPNNKQLATFGPRMVGNYVDRFVVSGDVWKFAHRKVEVAFNWQILPSVDSDG
jgi:SnoaL-like domain